uniref:Prominin-like protein n=1 Tax=Ceratitis capitata TaxID=7213 RepID=W8ASN3_CERCA
MSVSNFTYTPLPQSEERSLGDDMDGSVDVPKWTEQAVSDFGTNPLNYDDRENWSVILSTFKITIAIIIITIIVLLVGIIYLSLRCKGRLNPIKVYAETSKQRCIRYVLTVLMLFFIALILYFLIMAIKVSNAKKYVQEHHTSRDTRYRKLDHVLVYNYNEYRQQGDQKADDLIKDWVDKEVGNDKLKDKCPPTDDISTTEERVEEINRQFELLCLGVLEWSDYMRFFQRNMTTLMFQTEPGRKILKKLNFSNFLSKTMPIDKILDFYRIFSVLDNFFMAFSKLYTSTMDLPDTLEARTKSTLSPHFSEITEDLGKQFRTLSKKLGNEPQPERSFKSAEVEKNDLREPLWIFIWEWLCHVLIILIILSLLIALMLRCCGKRHRGEARCCNQKNGSWLFQLAAFMIFLYLLLALCAFLWHFVHGVGAYNTACVSSGVHSRREREAELHDNDLNVDCLDEKTFKKLVHDEVDLKINVSLPENVTLNGALNITLPNLRKQAITFKQRARMSKNLNMSSLCDEVRISMDPKVFTDVYEAMYGYANGDMPDDNDIKTLSLCNLNSFKLYRIDEYEESTVYKTAERMANYCDRVVDFFSENFANITTDCLKGMEHMRDELTRENKFNLSTLVDSLNDMYGNELDGYVDMATEALVNKAGLCQKRFRASSQETDCVRNAHLQNITWSALLILMWLFLPLIPIALYLARLYGMLERARERAMTRGRPLNRRRRREHRPNCSCESSKMSTTARSQSAAPAGGQQCNKWDTKSVMDEIQKHLYKNLCQNPDLSKKTTVQPNGKRIREKENASERMEPQNDKSNIKVLQERSANYAMLGQANKGLIERKQSKTCESSTSKNVVSISVQKFRGRDKERVSDDSKMAGRQSSSLTKTSPLRFNEPKVPREQQRNDTQRPTTSKGINSVLAKPGNIKIKKDLANKKCSCEEKSTNKAKNELLSSMKQTTSKREEHDEACEEIFESDKNVLSINTSIHIIRFNKKDN